MYFSAPLTVKEAAAALGCDKSTVYALSHTTIKSVQRKQAQRR